MTNSRSIHSAHAAVPCRRCVRIQPLTAAFLGLLLFLTGGCAKEPRFSSTSPEAISHYMAGVEHRNRFYLREAEQEFRQSLAADSGLGMAWLGLATVGYMQGSEPGARKNIHNALNLTGHANRREQFAIRMWAHRINFHLDEARATAESLAAEYPDEVCAYQFLGELASITKNQELSLKWFERAIAADSTFALSVMSLGYAYSNMGEQDNAIAAMERYIRLEPDAADPRASLADLFVRVGRYDEALELYRASLERKPDYWYAFQEIGQVYMWLGRLKAAEEQARRSAELVSGSPENSVPFLAFLTNTAVMRGNFEEAVELSRKALAKDSTVGRAAFQLAFALAKTGRFTAAHEVIRHLRSELEMRNLQESSGMAQFHLLRARVLTLEGEYEGALAACDSALGLSAYIDRPEIYRNLAEIRQRMGDTEGALDACSEALSSNPRQPFALLTLTRIYHKRNDTAMTAEVGNRLLQLWSGADADFSPLQELRRLLGQKPPTRSGS